MTPYLAAIVFILLIWGLLYRSSRRGSRLSTGLWVPTVWVGIMASKPVMYWFAGGEGWDIELGNYLDGNPIDRNILLVLMACGVAILARRRVDWTAVLHSNRILWVFYIYLAISILWSEYPFVSLKRWVKDVGNVVMILVILTEAKPIDALQRVFVRCSCVLVPLSVLFIKYFPEIGRYYHRWTWDVQYAGVTNNKNSLGVLAMISGLFLLWAILERNRDQPWIRRVVRMAPEVGVLGMTVWLLYLAGSATALGCFLIGAATLAICRLSWARRSARVTLAGLVGAFVLAVLVLNSSGARARVAESFGRDPTLTTRTDIWHAVLGLKTNILFGSGYASVWLTQDGWTLGRELRIPHAHNGYLETYLNSGVIGVILLLAVLLSGARNAAWHLRIGAESGPLFVAFMLAGTIYNFTEVTFNNNNAVGFALWIIALSSVNRPILAASTQAGSLGVRSNAWSLRRARLSAPPAVARGIAYGVAQVGSPPSDSRAKTGKTRHNWSGWREWALRRDRRVFAENVSDAKAVDSVSQGPRLEGLERVTCRAWNRESPRLRRRLGMKPVERPTPDSQEGQTGRTGTRQIPFGRPNRGHSPNR